MSLWWAAAQHLVFQVEREEREGGRKGDLHVAALSVCRSRWCYGWSVLTLLFPVPPFLALVHVSRLSLALFPASAATTRWLGYSTWVGEKDFVALELGTGGAFSRSHTKLHRKLDIAHFLGRKL